MTVNENDLTVTITSNGAIGFSGSNNDLGEGVKLLDGNTLLYEGGFVVGNSANYIPIAFEVMAVTTSISLYFKVCQLTCH